jgi:hypothetical protein
MPEEERFHELLDGGILEKANPSFEHGGAQGALSHLLFPFRRPPRGSGPGGWWIGTEIEIPLAEDLCRPDVAG